MLRRFLENHVLANVTFAVVLVMGTLAYLQMPRAKDPEINFNWISITVALPGASAEDVEKLVADPLEDAIRKVSDIKFVSSHSREGLALFSVRFEELSDSDFDKRMNDMRREIQAKANAELPPEAEDPQILEITSANSMPTAVVVVRGPADDELLRKVAMNVREDIEKLKGVDDVNTAGLRNPEIKVVFDPERLQAHGITPTQLADSITAQFRDVSAGEIEFGGRKWLARLVGKDSDPAYLAQLPVITSQGVVTVGSLAEVFRDRSPAEQRVLHRERPAVMLSVTKKAFANTLDMVQRLKDYIAEKNPVLQQLGVEIVLVDDQTLPTRQAIEVMQKNALLGLLLVGVVAWLFLGGHIAFFIGIGIPFTLAGTFWLLHATGETLNQSVLLGVVIVLGMLVDDAVVVVEAIYYRIQRGAVALDAAVASLGEVFKPVTASVMTTVAAFLPLMLLPGILGDFMFVIPFVVTVALAVSLLEAYWMLPVHIAAARVSFAQAGAMQRLRERLTHGLRVKYTRMLVWVFRRPKRSLLVILLLFASALGLLHSGKVRTEFFAFDPMRIFYVNITMPPGTPLDDTLQHLARAERILWQRLRPDEVREIASAAGQMFTETEPLFGDRYGQITVSLLPRKEGGRGVQEIVDSLRDEIARLPGPSNVAFMTVSGGPPVTRPIIIKVRGDDYRELRAATDALREVLRGMPAVSDIIDDDSPGAPQLKFRLDHEAVKLAGLHAADVARMLRLLFDGEIVARMQHEGEQMEIRVQADAMAIADVDDLLRLSIPLPQGGQIPLGQIAELEIGRSKGNIRHYNYRRTITLEAELDKSRMDTVAANRQIQQAWEKLAFDYPGVDLDFTGELDDIQESIDSMAMLFVFGIGLIYLILGTQFRSYWQPFMILATVPLAFTGVIFGLVVSGNPLSLYTLYGVVALAGIAVNAAIVMIDAANARLAAGMSVLHAILYAARRRVVPILITSLTTIAGLFSLAAGLGGESLIWGPVASAIVWGLAFSTVLTLFVIPMLYRLFMRRPGGIRP